MLTSKANYSRPSVSLKEHLPISIIVSIAIALYFYKLGAESLWGDEFYSIYDATAIPEQIPVVRPLYYLLLRLWMVFGSSETWLRTLSIPFSCGSIVFLYSLGCRLFNRLVGNVSALLLALSPVFLNHTQEVRMYTLSTFLGLLGTWFLLDVILDQKRVALIWWFIARVLAVLTTPLNILLFAPDSILLIWKLRHQRKVLLIVAGICFLFGIVALPFFIEFFEASMSFFGGWVADHPKPGVTSILSLMTNFTAFWPLKSLEAFPLALKFYKMYTIMAALVLSASIFIRNKKEGVFYTLAWAGLPAFVLLLVSWLFAPVWLPRYLLIAAPYLLLLLSAGFFAILQWQPKLAIAIAAIYLIAVGGGLYHYYADQNRDDWRGATAFINSQDEDNDVIVIHTGASRPKLFVEYYYDGESPINVLEISEDVEKLPPFDSRLWIVHKDSDPDSELSQEFKRRLQSKYKVEEHQAFSTETGWIETIEVFLVTKH